LACGALAGTQMMRVCEGNDREAAFRLNYILASSMYGTTPLEAILPEVGKIGATAIDIWPLPHGNQREQMDKIGHDALAQQLERRGLKLGILTRYDLGPWKLAGELPVAKRFGTRLIVCGSGGPRGLSGAELKTAVRKFVERLKPHLDRAADHGVTLGIENHANALIDSADSIRYLADMAPQGQLGVALAPYHLPQDTKLLASLIHDLDRRLVHFYAW